MPWESIGNTGSGQLPNDRDWIVFCYDTAISFLRHNLGDPPEGCEIDTMWHEHEFGDYPTVVVHWDHPQTDAPWDYINRCEILLAKLNEAISWSDLQASADFNDVNECTDEVDDDLTKEYAEELTTCEKNSLPRVTGDRSLGIINDIDKKSENVLSGGAMLGAFDQIVGKRIKGVVVKEGKNQPESQVFLIFPDNTFFEMYSSSTYSAVCGAKGLNRGSLADVRSFMAGPNRKIIFEKVDENISEDINVHSLTNRMKDRISKIDLARLSPEARELLNDSAFIEAISVLMP